MRGTGRRPTPSGRDVVGAMLLAATVLGGTAVVAPLQDPPETVGAGTLGMGFLAAAAWAWHRVAPVASAAAVVAIVALYVLVGEPYGPVLAVVVLACFAVARRRSLRTTVLTCTAVAFVLVGALWTRLDGSHPIAVASVTFGWTAVFVAVPALAGALVRTRAEAAERERAALVARGADEERLRVAREVHDIAGHGFAVVAMQAGVALTVLDEQPGQARASLEAIRSTGENALRELQAALDTLHADARDVPALVDRVRTGGLPVDLVVTGDAADLDHRRSTVVYRVVQEALTNVVRHAGPAAATVKIDYGPREVRVEVADGGAGCAHPPGSDGRGLRGLRGRVEGVGGSFEARNRPGGGFAVVAQMPVGSR